jgi:hydroxymethylpyrimidine/phosphomethylpyrimidine kinase
MLLTIRTTKEMYEVIKRIDAKKIILDSVAREDKKQAVIKADSLKLSKDTLTKKSGVANKREGY